jgi:hypothetical protein
MQIPMQIGSDAFDRAHGNKGTANNGLLLASLAVVDVVATELAELLPA